MINFLEKNQLISTLNQVMVIIFDNNLGEPQRKYEDEFTIIENEANEHEFNAGCLIF